MTSCPALNTFTNQNPPLVTVQNQKELRLSTYDRTQGTSVDLSCVTPLNLYGQSKVTCQSDGSWDFTTKPCCDNKDCIGSGNEGLTEQTKILIAILVSVAAVAVIIVCCVVCLISAKIKKKKRDQRSLYRDDESSKLGYMLDERAFFPPPYHWHPMAYPFESHRKKLDTPVQKRRSSLTIFGGGSLTGQNQFSRSMNPDRTQESRNSEPFKPIGWDDNKQTQRKISDSDIARNQPLAILSSEDLYGGKIYRSPARSVDSDRAGISQYKPRSVDSDRAGISQYKPRSVDSDYQKRTSDSEIVRSNEYRVSTVEPEFRKRATESELVRSDEYRINKVEPEYRESDYFRIVPDSTRPDTFRIVRISEPIKTEQTVESRQLIKTRNSFADNEWNKPLDNVYVSNIKTVQTIRPPQPPALPSRPTSEPPKRQFRGHWPARSEMKELKEFNRRALLNGRDPFLWSNVNSNFGFHLEYDK